MQHRRNLGRFCSLILLLLKSGLKDFDSFFGYGCVFPSLRDLLFCQHDFRCGGGNQSVGHGRTQFVFAPFEPSVNPATGVFKV